MRTRRGPVSRTRSTNASIAPLSEMSQATPMVPSSSGSRRSTATVVSAMSRARSMHARPMPLLAPVMTATVISGSDGDVVAGGDAGPAVVAFAARAALDLRDDRQLARHLVAGDVLTAVRLQSFE